MFLDKREELDLLREIRDLRDELREEIRHLRAAVEDVRRQLANPVPHAISVEDAATRLGCGRTQVFKYLKAGQLRRAKKHGRRVMVTVASVEALGSGIREPNSGRPRRQHGRRSAASLRASILALPLNGEG